MDIKQCVELLELEGTISAEKTKQAYRDMVNIWHPDRFSDNPRLKQKAEQKLKDINTAYKTLMDYLHATQGGNQKKETKGEKNRKKPTSAIPRRDRTEAMFEAGTGAVLRIWSNLSSFIHSMASDVKTGMDEGARARPRTHSYSGKGTEDEENMGYPGRRNPKQTVADKRKK